MRREQVSRIAFVSFAPCSRTFAFKYRGSRDDDETGVRFKCRSRVVGPRILDAGER